MTPQFISTKDLQIWMGTAGLQDFDETVSNIIELQKELDNPFICIRQYQADEVADALRIALRYVEDAQTVAERGCVAGTRAADVVTSAFIDEYSAIDRALRILQTDAEKNG